MSNQRPMPEVIDRPSNVDDVWRVISIMLFPSDPEARNEWIEQAQHWDFIRRRKDDLVQHDIHDDMGIDYWVKAQGFPSSKQVDRKANSRARGGTVAGDMLRHLYLMSECDIVEPSLRKANFIIRTHRREYQHSSGTTLHTETQINKFWTTYRPVSHLWAALRLNDQFRFIDDFLRDLSSFMIFLSIAKTLQDFVTSYIPRGKNGPLIPADCMILVSADIPAGGLGFKPDPTFYEKKLKKYKAVTP